MVEVSSQLPRAVAVLTRDARVLIKLFFVCFWAFGDDFLLRKQRNGIPILIAGAGEAFWALAGSGSCWGLLQNVRYEGVRYVPPLIR